MNAALQEFEGFLGSHGLLPINIVADGQQRRCPTIDKPHKNNGVYLLHQEQDSWHRGWCKDYASGEFHRFTYHDNASTALSCRADHDGLGHQRQKAQDQKRREQRQAKRARKEATHQRAGRAWNAAHAAQENHPYLRKKGISDHDDIRQLSGEALLREGIFEVKQVSGWRALQFLLIPIYDTLKRMVSLQLISPKKTRDGRDKIFLKDGEKRAGFFVISQQPRVWDGFKDVYFCEGYATGKSIYAAHHVPVVVCFDAGNLLPVIEAFENICPYRRKFIIAADNDAAKGSHTERGTNPGIKAAINSAYAKKNVTVAYPTFCDVTSEPTDYNDLLQLEGIEAVRQHLLRQYSYTEMVRDFPQLRPKEDQGVLRYQNYLSECFQIDPDAKGHVLLEAETGAGKTHLILRYMEQMRDKPFSACFTAPVTPIVEQMKRDLLDAGFVEGIDFATVLGGDAWPKDHNGLIICTYKSLAEKAGDYTPKLLVTDESHFLASADYMTAQVDAVRRMAARARTSIDMTGTAYEWQAGNYDRVIKTERADQNQYPTDIVYYPKGSAGQDALIFDLLKKKRQEEILIVMRNSKTRNLQGVKKVEKAGYSACNMDSDEKGEGSIYEYVLNYKRLPDVDVFFCTKLYETGLNIQNENVSAFLALPNEQHLDSPVTAYELKQGISRTRKHIPRIIIGIAECLYNDVEQSFDWEAVKNQYIRHQNTFLGQVQFWLDEGKNFSKRKVLLHQRDLFPVPLVTLEGKRFRSLLASVDMCVTNEYKSHIMKNGKTYRESFNLFGLKVNSVTFFRTGENFSDKHRAEAREEVQTEMQTHFKKSVEVLKNLSEIELRKEAKKSKIARKYEKLFRHFAEDAGDILLYIGYEDAPYNQICKWLGGMALIADTTGLSALLDSFARGADAKNVEMPTNEEVRKATESHIKNLPGQEGVLARKRMKYSPRAKKKQLSHKAALMYLRNFANCEVILTNKKTIRRVRISLNPIKKLYEDATKKDWTKMKEEYCLRFDRGQCEGDTLGLILYKNMTMNVSPSEEDITKYLSTKSSEYAEEQIAMFGKVF